MKKFAKVLMLAVPAFALVACSNSSSVKGENTDAKFGGMTAQELQQRYNTVYFALDSYQIDAQSQQVLDAHSLLLTQKTDSKVLIEGHADERGTPEYNIALGQRRADAVQQYLNSKGVSVSQISTLSYGEEKPAVLGHSEVEYEKNRRAVLAY